MYARKSGTHAAADVEFHVAAGQPLFAFFRFGQERPDPFDRAGEDAFDFRRYRPAQVRPTQHHAFDAPAFHVRRQAATGGFYFGEFWHGGWGSGASG